MPDLLVALEAFVQEHRLCGELETAVIDGMVWVVCEYGAMLARRVDLET